MEASPSPPLPLLVAIHCLAGCTASMEVEKWKDASAADTPFAILAPEGYRHSWNAGPCCGSAKQKQLDDAGFVEALVLALLSKHSLQLDSRAVYMTGFSNGGFFSSLFPVEMSRRKSQLRVRAIAPSAGYLYTGLDEIPAGTGLFYMHSASDEAVRPQGCCRESICCCGISDRVCTSAQDFFTSWLRANNCSSTNTTDNPYDSNRRSGHHLPMRDGQLTSSCWHGHSCHAAGEAGGAVREVETTYCSFAHVEHGSWAGRAPFAEAAVEFFARDLQGLRTSAYEEEKSARTTPFSSHKNKHNLRRTSAKRVRIKKDEV